MGAGTTALVGMGVSALSSSIGAGVSARRAARRAKEMRLALENFENNRQDVINPYAGVENLSDMATNLSDRITNPFADLAVATQAAEMQAEEADIALANTLDTLRATGASAGGATALAMAALKSKKDVAVSISEQEAANAKEKAKGEEAMMREKVKAQTRYQDVLIEQGERDQQADIEGEIFMYQANEARSNADIERYQGMYQGFAAQQNQARIAKGKASASMIGGIGDALGGVFSSDGKP